MVVALSTCLGPLARAQSNSGSSATVAIAIPAQPMGQALNELARQANLRLSFSPALVAGKTAPALSGSITARQALDRLLVGSGLVAVIDGSTVLVEAAPPVAAPVSVLPVVTVVGNVEAQPGDIPRPYAGGQVARGSRQGMLGNTDVFDTPFSTKAFTAELIQNQGARNLIDVAANDPSIRAAYSPATPLDQSSIRGFDVGRDAFLFDGLPGLAGYGSIAVQNYERVEVFKGPSAALSGASAQGSGVGGGFNLVPKRGTDVPVRSVTLSGSDKSLLGAHLDLGGRFGIDNAFGVRLNVSTENGELFNDSKRSLVAPLIALDYRGDTVRVVLDAGAVRYRSTAAFNFTSLLEGATLPAAPNPRTNSNAPWETITQEQVFGVLSAEWDFARDWTVYARHGRFHEDSPTHVYLNTTPLDSAGNFTITGSGSFLNDQDNAVTELGARGKLTLGSTTHRLAFSAVAYRDRLHNARYGGEDFQTPVAASIYTRPSVPDQFPGGIPDVPSIDYPPARLTSYAVADSVALLDDSLRLTLALRHQSIKAEPYAQSRVTPTAAVLYKLGGGISIYGNHAEALSQGDTAPDIASNAGQQLPPYVSKQQEFGVKWDRGTYGLTAAYFDIRKAFAFIDGSNVFRAAGQQRNKGLELETFGEPVRGLRVLGGVAWTDAKQSRTEGGATDGKRGLGVAEFTANLGAEADLTAVPGLTLTGRIVHTGAAYLDLGNTQQVPAWNRVDLGARYQTRIAGRQAAFRVGIDNLFDKTDWTTGGFGLISVAPPRIWRVSTTVGF